MVRWENQVAGDEASFRLLSACWQAQPTNEDAFRMLAELLGKRERFHYAEECYSHLCEVLAQEGRTPHARTEQMMEFVRAKKIQRELPTDSITMMTRQPPSSFLLKRESLFSLPIPLQERTHTEFALYDRAIRAALHIHQTSNAQRLLQEIDADMQDLESLEEQADGPFLVPSQNTMEGKMMLNKIS